MVQTKDLSSHTMPHDISVLTYPTHETNEIWHHLVIILGIHPSFRRDFCLGDVGSVRIGPRPGHVSTNKAEGRSAKPSVKALPTFVVPIVMVWVA